MTEASRLPSTTGLRALTYGTLIGLLASTGIRPGEAMTRDVHDVDLTNGVLAIRQTKFGKSRFVPVDESTRVALACYAQRRDELCLHRGNRAFLVSERGTRLKGSAARRTFAKLCCISGLRTAAEGRRIGLGPRLMDFRHTFATWKLVEWYRVGLNVQREIPKLTAYLGPVNLSDTHWYIEAIPELLRLATEQLTARQRGGSL